MIEDLSEHPRDASIAVDICLVGAGAAGITLAREFTDSALRVCLVEGGGLQYEYAQSQQLYTGESVGVPVSLEAGRLRFFGGTTNHWGGRCAPLDDTDFRRRDWVPKSGWPIDRRDLDPYYARARTVSGFTTAWGSNAETLTEFKIALPPIGGARLEPFLWHYTPATPGAAAWRWGEAYGEDLRRAGNVRVLLHANFVEFSANETRSHVHSLKVASLGGISATITARVFVLCCGGIENARLLLLASEGHAGGFGNDHGLVGRCFMQHPRGSGGLLVGAHRLSRLQEQFNLFRAVSGAQIEVGLALTPEAQEKDQLLNCSAIFEYQGDPESGVSAAQDVWRALLAGHWAPDMGEKVARIAGDFDECLHALERRSAAGHSLDLEGSAGIPSRSATLLLDLEQAPNPESRVMLSEHRDALGLRQVRVDWRFGDLERRTAERMVTYIAAAAARLGLGRCQLAPWLRDPSVAIREGLNETYHYIGTTRMADDPREGVVDRTCAVHGMDNLYVAGSSVFATAGQANPTLTLVALALRLADHLKQHPALRSVAAATEKLVNDDRNQVPKNEAHHDGSGAEAQ